MARTHEMTQATYDRLKAEHTELTTVWRIEIARKIEAARELGDLSENGDYHAAKEEQGKTEARIGHLGALLEDAVIVEGGLGGDTVAPGSVVSLVYEGDDDVERYLIGLIEERHEGVEVISPTSPLGSALIGAKVGDTVSYHAPSGELRVEVRALD